MNNIIKHSGADVVELSLKMVENRVQLRVKDNGVGFNRNVILKENAAMLGHISPSLDCPKS